MSGSPRDASMDAGRTPIEPPVRATESHSSTGSRPELPILSRRGLIAALRETAIVVLGVLIALWVNNWNEGRTERMLEGAYLSRLAEDLQADTATFRQMGHVAEDKEEHLKVVGQWLRSPAGLPDTVRFLQATIGSASLSWAHPPVRRTTFQELENTGGLRLISDERLRVLIISYYFFAADEANRVNQRRTGYGSLSYQLLPHQGYGMIGLARDQEAGGTTDVELLQGLGGAERQRLAALIRSSELATLVQAEENFARFARRSQAEVQKKAVALLNDVEAHIR
jgi:hypothetical protein